MDTLDLHADAWEGIRRGFDAGRTGHAYILVGSPRGHALHFAEALLKLLFCSSSERPCGTCLNCRLIDSHKHVDTLWIEPQSKSRQIKAEEIRALVHRMTQTSFQGGWKAGIVLAADCMNTQSANALLKTLEEPPPGTLLILVTESPQSLLPTIVSRCQKIVLAPGGSNDAMDETWRAPLMAILHDLPPSSGLSAAGLASRLKGLFDTVKAGIADVVEEDFSRRDEALDESRTKDILAARTHALLKEVQSEVFRVILDWHRDVLMLTSGVEDRFLVFPADRDVLAGQAGMHTQGSALMAVRAVETMVQRLDRNLPDLQIFDETFRKLVR